ncbi:hypothetical protein NBRC10512_004972 [Rhodotorula toruloides]|uniref:RHTO0S01e14004g1_1 n=2 Tax=Rhodotorula toruloides TaxID=5286 RepID=A0A061AG29_RHOTO|nr:uncharacterized protein RHTO_04640 [Rhodotorula toruloides NP11]EMS24461.1 hypothetical protein RHTO_04640 [Rhodotorula toruloides NP11]CDR36088.1 RHTO0S01e14004g1_1 [Rhodotorula toruloides]
MPSAPLNSGFVLQDDPATPRTEATVSFRDILPKPDHPRIAGIADHTALSWCESRKAVEAPAWLINRLDVRNIGRPYRGFSADGHPDPSIFRYEEDEGAPVEAAVHAVNRLLDALPADLRKEVVKGDVATDDEFRAWSNPELYVNPGGIRLDETSTEIKDRIHDVLKASLSPEGYKKALGCTLTNHFLGELVNGSNVLNKHSYNFRLFLPPATRRPSLTDPWGWTFFGHHLCLAVCFVGKRMVIGPTFMGAEPDRIDVGPHAGLRLFSQEEIRGLNLMRSLSEENQKKAQISVGMTMSEGLAEDRWNPFDERHLGGAHQDNRIVPYEGCQISLFTPEQRDEIYAILRVFNIYLPEVPLEHRMRRLRSFEDQTYFAWIGKFDLGSPYYFRIHSPATFCEFDFHCGIFLTNTSPAKCHIHTVNRLPNCEDYGKALVQQWQREQEAEGVEVQMRVVRPN